ncbi:hypothetical protein REIP_0792 [Rickettsia endosymbiont of Ixodes pacificus]|nr:hypothetical protein REIP_0792 [Rickettsia endosymbiont of Ixodes pacificus]
MVYEYVKQQKGNLIDQIIKKKFYHGLSNGISPNELPVLQSDSRISYWGNENSSVSLVLLKSIAKILKAETPTMIGAATFYLFYNPKYKLPKDLVPKHYPFANEEGILLFGDYQFGGHNYFENWSVFAPEDCSSSVGKATYVKAEQIKDISTQKMKEDWSQYGYELVVKLDGSINDSKLELVKPGDICLYKDKPHVGIIANILEKSITTLQFARDIDREREKILGGGIYYDNLSDDKYAAYILRSNLEPLSESISLSNLLN